MQNTSSLTHTVSFSTDRFLAQRWFWFFVCLHILVWTLIPNGVRSALPMDAAEGVVWGHHLELGYDRNPWLNAWLTRAAIEIGGRSDLVVYLFSQLSVALAFWSIWCLGCKMKLTPLQAVVAVLMLEGVQYYTFAAIQFNDNTLELGLWSLLSLLFYMAITTPKYKYWVGVGLVAGLGMMAKYYTAILLFALFVFLLSHSKGRKSFTQPSFYMGLCVFIGLISPHIYWLFQHDFVTVQYALNRVHDTAQDSFWHYIQPSVQFTVMQLVTFLGALGIYFLGVWGKKHSISVPAHSPYISPEEDRFNKQFLWIVGVGPYLITVFLGLFAGWQLEHTLWGMPLLNLWGLLLVYFLRPSMTHARFYRFLCVVSMVFVVCIAGYTWVALQPGSSSSGNFPARQFAQDITAQWHARYQKPLSYVVGDRVLCSYMTRYSSDTPQAHLDWESKTNPWIDLASLRREGAIFLQRAEEKESFPAKIQAQYPRLQMEEIHYATYVRTAPDSKPIPILVGILPPQNIGIAAAMSSHK